MLRTTRLLALVVLPLTLLVAAQPSFAAAAKKHRTSKLVSSRTTHSKRTAARKPLGPRGIDNARATQIQSALIRSGYLTGEPSGHWDAASQAAMVKLQSDNGWQTKLVPDSRALIKLGLGPGAGPNPTLNSQETSAANFTSPARP